MNRFAKIVATLGPASRDEGTLEKLILSGVDITRLNFSHGSHSDHSLVIRRLRSLSDRLIKPVGILQDLQGPKIRTGEIEGGNALITAGQELVLTNREILGNEHWVSVDFPDLARAVQPGGRILLDDGNLELKVIQTEGADVRTLVVVGGILKPNKGVNLPGANLDIPALTEKDLEDLAFGLANDVDMLALSFVRSARDVEYLRSAIQRLDPAKKNIPIIAKLERPEAMEHLQEIVHVADGVMVARGDLGVEMSPQEVPIAQKRIIEQANRHSKLVITATQMLESMIQNPRPTRAEASDVANAILDGSDAVMLSGETAVGKYPVQTVEMMNAIICQAEAHATDWGRWHQPDYYKGDEQRLEFGDDAYFVTQAAREMAHDRNVAAIAVFTVSGRSALLMSKARPRVPILAFTPNQATYNRMALYWGVHPYLVPHANTIETMLVDVEEVIVSTQLIRPGQQIVLICGFPVDSIRPTNLALLYTVGSMGL
jgi:pyruvate kinase